MTILFKPAQRWPALVFRSGDLLKWLLLTGIAGLGGWLLLNGFVWLLHQSGGEPVRNAAELDSLGRKEAIEVRKRLLSVSGLPYPATSREILTPLHNDAHQRFFSAQFTDPVSGLSVAVDTHLCFPGVDPCISGGEATLSDGVSVWRITFQFLGAENPTWFRSQIPKSRSLLSRMRSMKAQVAPLQQSVYYTALKNALDAKADSPQMQSAAVHLVQLLLASYFATDEFEDTLTFAEQHQLLTP